MSIFDNLKEGFNQGKEKAKNEVHSNTDKDNTLDSEIMNNVFLAKPDKSPLSQDEWDKIIERQFTGEERIIKHVEIYKDLMAMFLDKGDPLIMLLKDGVPLYLDIWPETDDKIVILGEGRALPAVYNKTANAYLFNKYMDDVVADVCEISGIDFLRISKQLEIALEPNLITRKIKEIYESFVGPLIMQMMTPLYIFKFLKVMKKMLEYNFKLSKYNRPVKFEGNIISVHNCQYKYSSQNGTHIKYFITLRVMHTGIMKIVSCKYHSSHLYRFNELRVPPEGSVVTIEGDYNSLLGYVIINKMYYANNRMI